MKRKISNEDVLSLRTLNSSEQNMQITREENVVYKEGWLNSSSGFTNVSVIRHPDTRPTQPGLFERRRRESESSQNDQESGYNNETTKPLEVAANGSYTLKLQYCKPMSGLAFRARRNVMVMELLEDSGLGAVFDYSKSMLSAYFH